MLLTDRQSVSTAPGVGANSLRLRLGNEGQLIDLPLGKTTVGSSPRCNLRIEKPGIQPLHCLIVHGQNGLSVRRWAADTTLNGAAFDEAPLAAGDCLALAGVEVELVSPAVELLDRKTSATTANLPLTANALANDLGARSQTNPEAPPIARARETAAFEWNSERLALDAVAVDANESTEDECAMLMEVVQESFDAMNSLEGETADEVADDSFEYVTQERAPAAEAAVEEATGAELGSDVAVADEHDSELPGDEAADPLGEIATDDETTCGDAAVVVFRELQAACAMSRSRSRKMLTALRKEREQKRELLERLTEAGEQLQALSARQADDTTTSELESDQGRDWEREARRLHRRIALWEQQIAGYVARLAELQHELAAAKASEAVADDAIESTVSPLSRVEATGGHGWEPTAGARLSHEPASGPEFRFNAAALATHSPASCILQEGEGARTATEGDIPEPAIETPIEVSSEEVTRSFDERAINDSPFGTLERQAGGWEVPPRDAADFGEGESTAEPTPIGEVGQPLSDGDTSNPFGNAPQSASWSDTMRESRVGEWKKSGCKDWSAMPVRDDAASGVGDARESSAAAAIEVETPVWTGGAAENSHSAIDHSAVDSSPFAEFSIWRQGVQEELPAVDSHVEAEPHGALAAEQAAVEEPAAPAMKTVPELFNPASAQVAVVEHSAPAIREITEPTRPATQPTSFIDRYAHLFEENRAQVEPAASHDSPAASINTNSTPPGVMGDVRSESAVCAAAASNEEESIEEYMAKLLQRVRGDVPAVNVLGVASAPKLVAAAGDEQVTSAPVVQQVPLRQQLPDGDESESGGAAERVEVDWDLMARKAAAAPTADLGALRALANQTARRAINRHALTKHRRDTVTKVIVSTLAGMTSLWLMLDAPRWYDLQCVTACIALIGAAYWAGDACREMAEAWRVAAAYEALHGEEVVDAPLPIDVEERC